MRKLSIILILGIISCGGHGPIQDAITDVPLADPASWKSMNRRETPDSLLLDLVLNQGDTMAYTELSISYLDYPSGSFLKIAQKVADKYDYACAHYDVYVESLILCDMDSCDANVKLNALKHLKKAVLLGDQRAIDALKDLELTGELEI